jgi:GNAT superfamily N-acetyltransferase
MAICTITADEFAEFIAFINVGMRPDGAPTRAEDDFPVILGRENLAGLWGLRDREGFAAGLSCLVRPFTTDHGTVLVAGIGSVVTRADRRGEGLSGRIQQTVLQHLRKAGVHLAVLWTDRPEIYAGRGFTAAGYEYHVDVAAADLPPAGSAVEAFADDDADAVADIYRRHSLRTARGPADHAALYGMPGTRGLVSRRDGRVGGYVFCGKGEDFPGYVAEWGGPPDVVMPLLAAARAAGLATRVLVGRRTAIRPSPRHGWARSPATARSRPARCVWPSGASTASDPPGHRALKDRPVAADILTTAPAAAVVAPSGPPRSGPRRMCRRRRK